MVNDLMRCHALAVRPTMKAVQKILFGGGKLQFSPAAPRWHQ
jgi:hypothetical protein